MLTREDVRKAALRLYDFCENPAVRYAVFFRLLDTPYEDETLARLRPPFLESGIVEELAEEQDYNGGWGPLQSKDYSQKARFPTSTVAINRCLYIGLTIEDRDILIRAYEYLEDFLKGTSREKLYNKNERAVPWQTARICEMIEAVKPGNSLCDRTCGEWLYIASRAYEDGEYSYERDRKAQHELFWTKEDRLVPMQSGLLLKRRGELPPGLEEAMLRHLGGHAARHGWFWDKTPDKLPEDFVCGKSRRWFHTFNYINQFRGSALFLSAAAEWLMERQNTDGLWDWGPQTKDPWGYFGYFSTARGDTHTRTVDCTMEVLSFLKTYLDHNEN
ncbi:MAG: hypothetical protein LBH95_00640 [Oscillospiraceae bacterium]|nr:hypothetical protein [Oscillospiraceae bacterium]